MSMTVVYIFLCVLGTAVPLAELLPFLIANGLALRLILDQLFANQISSFFAWDVIFATVVVWVFVVQEGRRLGLRHLWAPIACSLTVGVSLALPLFLLMREQRSIQGAPETT